MCAHPHLAHPRVMEFCLVKWKEDSRCKLENVSITSKVSELTSDSMLFEISLDEV